MNRRKLLRLIAAMAGAGVLPTVSRSADVVREPRSVANFDRVVVHGVIDLSVSQGEREQLFVTAEPRLMGNIVTRVEQRTLIIETVGTVRTQKKLQAELTLRALERLEADGSCDVHIGALKGGTLSLEVSGNADVKAQRLALDMLRLRVFGAATAALGGTARSQVVVVGGSADYRGAELDSATAQVAASGSASARLRAREALDANVTGSADVTYLGNPKVRSKVGDAASLEHG